MIQGVLLFIYFYSFTNFGQQKKSFKKNDYVRGVGVGVGVDVGVITSCSCSDVLSTAASPNCP
jgi:hypothetical protein